MSRLFKPSYCFCQLHSIFTHRVKRQLYECIGAWQILLVEHKSVCSESKEDFGWKFVKWHQFPDESKTPNAQSTVVERNYQFPLTTTGKPCMWRWGVLNGVNSNKSQLNACALVYRSVAVAVKLSLLTIGLVGSVHSQQCQHFNSSFLSSTCGYNYTVKFQQEKHFNTSYTNLISQSNIFGNCSEYSNVIHCSIHFPRCKENLGGPYLPCKRVCDEYIKGCQEEIIQGYQEWVVGLCQLLPESDDPKMAKGYLDKCFEPPNFKPSSGKSILELCKLYNISRSCTLLVKMR